MYEQEIPITFNCLLKLFHINLVTNKIIVNTDILVYDEVQDTTSVSLEIFKLINAKKKLMVGDEYQNIYDFIDTVNAFDLLTSDVIKLNLTKSFRCSEYIASIVQDFGRKHLHDNFVFTGTDGNINENTVAYLSAYNTSSLYSVYQLMKNKKPFSLLKDTKDLFSLPTALQNVERGNTNPEKQFKYIEKEYNK